jgi:hypothetical protein
MVSRINLILIQQCHRVPEDYHIRYLEANKRHQIISFFSANGRHLEKLFLIMLMKILIHRLKWNLN